MSAIRFLSCLVFLTQTTSLNPNRVEQRLLFKYVHTYKMFVRMLSGRLMRRKVNILIVTAFVIGAIIRNLNEDVQGHSCRGNQEKSGGRVLNTSRLF